MRDRAPAGMDIAAGEYGYDIVYFERMLEADAVDVLQADATRCAGFTGFLQAAAPVRSASPSAFSSLRAGAASCMSAAPRARFGTLEYFHDHVRIEEMLFDGVPKPDEWRLAPDLSRPVSVWN